MGDDLSLYQARLSRRCVAQPVLSSQAQEDIFMYHYHSLPKFNSTSTRDAHMPVLLLCNGIGLRSLIIIIGDDNPVGNGIILLQCDNQSLRC